MYGSGKCVRLAVFSFVMLGAWLSAAPAAAQDQLPMFEVSGGYNFIRVFDPSEGDGEDENWPGGWYADVAGNVNDFLAIVGQVNGNYKSEEELGIDVDGMVHSFMGGARLSYRMLERAVPYGQVLVGGTKIDFSADAFDFDASDTFFTVQAGGGVIVPYNDRIGFRAGADWIRIIDKDDDEVELEDDMNVFRAYVGIVINFGTR